MKKLIIIVFVVIFVRQLFGVNSPVVLGPGVKVAEPPVQTDLNQAKPFQHNDFQITPLAEFKLKGKVLSREDYSFGRESDLSPIDLALGWGPMSDEAVLDKIDISQSGRWYHWRVKEFPIPQKDIETQSANMHMVPANEYVETMLEKTKQGQIIELSGYLIKAEAADGWHWQSSTTRNDTGAGACELIYVESFQLIN